MSRNIFQQLYYKDLESAYQNFHGVIFDNVVDKIDDLQTYFSHIRKILPARTRIMVSYHNPSWEIILQLASFLRLRERVGVQNWIDPLDLKNILTLSGFTNVSTKKRFLGITCITTATSTSYIPNKTKKIGVSIIIPAKNEAGNIPKIIPNIPKFGKFQEIIFVEGNSKDATWKKILDQVNKYKNDKFITVRALKQPGKGKAEASWIGLSMAKGEILMIYDADMTVPASDLPKFYDAIVNNFGRFANGNRLLYPMESGAMQTLNKLGNQIFSSLFTWILGQRFKDTLCGTKVFYKKDFKKFTRSTSDPFGDFDLIFGAIRNSLKVVDIPVRYRERVYGSTNINRFYHGLLLAKMTILAFVEFKLLKQQNTQ